MTVTIKSTKWYGWFWPPERKKIKIMQAIYDYNEPEITKVTSKALKDYLIYGVYPEYTNYKKGKL